MSAQGVRGDGRHRNRIAKADANKARAKLRNLTKDLSTLSEDELVVLLSEVSAELAARGGSDVVPRGLQQRLARAVE